MSAPFEVPSQEPVAPRPERPKRVSAAALARSLGISAAAVSYALRGRPGVSDELRQTILAEARKAGIPIPSEEAGDARLPTIGLVLANVGNPFYSEFAVSLSDIARAQQCEVLLSTTQDLQQSVESTVRTFADRGIQGLVITSLDSMDGAIAQVLRTAKIPFVLVSRRWAHIDADFVGIDDYTAGRDAMAHLLGHAPSRVGILAGPRTSTASQARLRGYVDELDEHGLSADSHLIVRANLNFEDGQGAAGYFLSTPQRPDAVICGSDTMALGLIQGLARHGVRVPQDIAVMGFDGLAMGVMADLTTIIQPRAEMAKAAFDLLIQRRQDPTLPPRTVICTHSLRRGATCGCLTTKDTPP